MAARIKPQPLGHPRNDVSAWTVGTACLLEFSALLYEQIVFIPNFLMGNPIDARSHFAQLHAVTNPGHFHALVGGVLTVGLGIIWRDRHHANDPVVLKRLAASVLLAGGLSLVAITVLNPVLFFADGGVSPDTLEEFAWVWSGVNILRLLLLATAARHCFGMIRKN